MIIHRMTYPDPIFGQKIRKKPEKSSIFDHFGIFTKIPKTPFFVDFSWFSRKSRKTRKNPKNPKNGFSPPTHFFSNFDLKKLFVPPSTNEKWWTKTTFGTYGIWRRGVWPFLGVPNTRNDSKKRIEKMAWTRMRGVNIVPETDFSRFFRKTRKNPKKRMFSGLTDL